MNSHDAKAPIQIFLVQSSRFRVDLLSYESKTTDKREKYDWRVDKNLEASFFAMYEYVVKVLPPPHGWVQPIRVFFGFF